MRTLGRRGEGSEIARSQPTTARPNATPPPPLRAVPLPFAGEVCLKLDPLASVQQIPIVIILRGVEGAALSPAVEAVIGRPVPRRRGAH